jgi:hypothetical protein
MSPSLTRCATEVNKIVPLSLHTVQILESSFRKQSFDDSHCGSD